jgi:hypothetical protein
MHKSLICWACLALCLLPRLCTAALLSNPGFDSGVIGNSASLPGWQKYNTNAYNLSNPAIARNGTNFLKVYQAFTGTVNYSGVYQDYISGPGAAYSADGWAYTATNDALAGQNAAWIEITFRDAAAYAQIRAECEELSSIAEAIGCPYIVLVPGKIPAGGLSSYEVIEESVQVLRELASIGERHGVALAFEFLGQKDCSVQTVELAGEIVSKVNRRNIGLVIDSFHFHTGGSTIKMIEARCRSREGAVTEREKV